MDTYVLLWDVIDRTFDSVKQESIKDSSYWPGFPKLIVNPNPIQTGVQQTKPTPPFQQNNNKRNDGYAPLSTYNRIS